MHNVYITPKSQLGNVMFEYCFLKWYAKENNMKSYLALNGLPKSYWNQYLDTFLFKDANLIDVVPYGCKKVIPQRFHADYVDLSQYAYSDVEFEGLFQNEKYWSCDRNFALELFNPPDSFINDIRNLYADVDFNSTVSVHIRRGDFFLQHEKFISTKEYVCRVIDEFIESNDKILIFSNDLNWCRKNFIGDRYIIADRVHEKYHKFLIDMFCMTLCKDNIVNNMSTFSWWGAYLNTNVNRRVFYSSKNLKHLSFIPEDNNWIDVKF